MENQILRKHTKQKCSDYPRFVYHTCKRLPGPTDLLREKSLDNLLSGTSEADTIDEVFGVVELDAP